MICKFFNRLFSSEHKKQEPTKKEYFGVLEAEQYLYGLGYVKVLLEGVQLSKIELYDAFFIQSESQVPLCINIQRWYTSYERSIVNLSIGKFPDVVRLYLANPKLSFQDKINDVLHWIENNQDVINEKRNLIIKEEQLQLDKKMAYLMLPVK